MLKRLLSLTVCLCLTFGLVGTGSATAIESDGIDVIVNNAVIDLDVPVQIEGQTSYVSYWPVVRALYPDAYAVWQDGQVIVTATGLFMTIQPDRPYIISNGRYLYMPQGIKVLDGIIQVPSRVLAAALGANVSWDTLGRDVVFTAGTGPIVSGEEFYPDDVVYWLSHIIFAESGNQSLEGKIAVGNVVLNRVNSPKFPNTVYEVIFQRGQFTPVSNGSIYKNPTLECVIAAKLCLDGANTVGDALYFLNPRTATNSWAARTRPYVATIGAHAFYA